MKINTLSGPMNGAVVFEIGNYDVSISNIFFPSEVVVFVHSTVKGEHTRLPVKTYRDTQPDTIIKAFRYAQRRARKDAGL